MSSPNGTKIKILTCLSDGQWWPTSDVAFVCGLGLTNASELLRRYRSQSLVVRERNPKIPRGYFYHITLVGLERLDFLTKHII